MKKPISAIAARAFGLLLIIIFFAQCGNLHFMQRKYTKGYYHDSGKELSHKKTNTKPAELPEVDGKTDLSVTTPAPVESEDKGDGAIASAAPDNNKPADTKASAEKLPDPKALLKLKAKVSAKTLKNLAKLPFSEVLVQKPKKSDSAKGGDDHLPSTILSIVGFACGILAIILAIFAIIDSLIIAAVSFYFYIAIALGIIAIACGITALVLGHGDLDGFQKTFSALAIALGGAGLLIALVWSFLISMIVAE
ncbi:MAG: hypothetical protein JST26_04165 [Bacteroidetes bacterium]|nr:hypothetical protein [Bacteroidota bacterium]